jgi:hypothetical protein
MKTWLVSVLWLLDSVLGFMKGKEEKGKRRSGLVLVITARVGVKGS